MRHYDEELMELQQQAAMKNRLETILKELRAQKSMLESRAEELSLQMGKEQLDVERLERRSLVNYFYQVVGKLDEKLTREKREAYEAAVKYDSAYIELKSVEAELCEKESEYAKVHRSDERYREVLKEKQKAVKLSDIPEAAEVFRLEAQMGSLDFQTRELEEAIFAGQRADQITDEILRSLSDAKRWGAWDLMGGSFFSDIAKHNHLDEAQGQVERLQEALRKFKTELADVEIIADIQVNIDGFLRFADFFFDGLFADWSVMNRIDEAQHRVREVKTQITSLLGKLNTANASVKNEKESVQRQLQELVRKAAL